MHWIASSVALVCLTYIWSIWYRGRTVTVSEGFEDRDGSSYGAITGNERAVFSILYAKSVQAPREVKPAKKLGFQKEETGVQGG